MYCPNCNAPVPTTMITASGATGTAAGTVNCPNCGAPLPMSPGMASPYGHFAPSSHKHAQAHNPTHHHKKP